VRDAACEPADGLHLLRLTQCLLGFFPPSDFLLKPAIRDRLALCTA
jgi:hypothetical protein